MRPFRVFPVTTYSPLRAVQCSETIVVVIWLKCRLSVHLSHAPTGRTVKRLLLAKAVEA